MHFKSSSTSKGSLSLSSSDSQCSSEDQTNPYQGNLNKSCESKNYTPTPLPKTISKSTRNYSPVPSTKGEDNINPFSITIDQGTICFTKESTSPTKTKTNLVYKADGTVVKQIETVILDPDEANSPKVTPKSSMVTSIPRHSPASSDTTMKTQSLRHKRKRKKWHEEFCDTSSDEESAGETDTVDDSSTSYRPRGTRRRPLASSQNDNYGFLKDSAPDWSLKRNFDHLADEGDVKPRKILRKNSFTESSHSGTFYSGETRDTKLSPKNISRNSKLQRKRSASLSKASSSKSRASNISPLPKMELKLVKLNEYEIVNKRELNDCLKKKNELINSDVKLRMRPVVVLHPLGPLMSKRPKKQ